VLRPASFVDALVLDAVAAAAQLERGSLDLRTPLLDINIDSLTLIAVVTRIEVACGIGFDSDEIAALVGVRDLRELCERVRRKIAERAR
jgi:acyl carrier protein